MNVYIASHSKEQACAIANALSSAGARVTSTWHDIEFLRTHEHSEADRESTALRDTDEIDQADVLVLDSGQEKYAGGKFVEAGYALGTGKTVLVIGRRENMLLWHPLIKFANTTDEAIAILAGISL